MSQAEAIAGLIGAALLALVAIRGIWLWFWSGPASPEPWDGEVAAKLEQEECLQLCHRCLTPNEPSFHFCPHCGAMVGKYTGLLPPLYYYAIGDAFRAGAEGRYRRSTVVTMLALMAGIVFLSMIPAPVGVICLLVYWWRLLGNIPGRETQEEACSTSAPSRS